MGSRAAPGSLSVRQYVRLSDSQSVNQSNKLFIFLPTTEPHNLYLCITVLVRPLDRFSSLILLLIRRRSKVLAGLFNILVPPCTKHHFCPLFPHTSRHTHRLDLKLFSLFILDIIEGICSSRSPVVCFPSCVVHPFCSILTTCSFLIYFVIVLANHETLCLLPLQYIFLMSCRWI